MTNYHARIAGHDVTISGDTLAEAVVLHFDVLARAADLGNAAGYRLVQAPVLEPGPEGHTIGGKPYTVLFIVAEGLPLAHGRTTPAKMTKIFFEGIHVAEPVTIPLRVRESGG